MEGSKRPLDEAEEQLKAATLALAKAADASSDDRGSNRRELELLAEQVIDIRRQLAVLQFELSPAPDD